MKRSCLIPVVAVVIVMACLVVAGIGYFLLAAPASTPIVLIDSPRNGEQVGVNQETIIHAVARSEQNIKRVELWVDGALRDAQTSSVPGGVSPFPIVVNWSPPVSGTHNIIVRAFTSQNTRGQSSINVQAQTSGDRDGDSVPDAIDGCPDQPGLTTNNGCPVPTAGDRDGDGVPDSADACADQPGTTLANGCPDADADGVHDAVDACPRDVGTAENNGCPAPGDADGDGVADASDACPREAGTAALSGCPDRDGDSVRDADDACPDAAGVPGLAGCPDRDGDGVRDALDLCPDVPGSPINSGCPVSAAGDSDGDGVHDDTDLAPSEAGPADSGGAPLPGGGTDGDSDGVPDAEEASEDLLGGVDLFFPAEVLAFTQVEIQALEFQVSGDYTSVSCYATVGAYASEHIGPLAALTAHRWDIAAFMGPLNSRTLIASANLPLQVHIECGGIAGGTRTVPEPGVIGDVGGDETYFDLGSVTRTHDISTTDIQEVTVDSSGGNPGHSFSVKYRVCTPGCKTPVLHAPMITLMHGGGQNRLAWAWAGRTYDINGFKLYMNGNYMFNIDAHNTSYLFHDTPPCGRQFDIQLSAYRGNPHRPDQESPLSNIATWNGESCTRTATVSFERLETGNLRSNDDIGNVGPLFGTFWVNDSRRAFDSHERLDASDRNHAITDFYPRNEFSVDLEPDDWLTIGATIKDRDLGWNPNDTIFDWEECIPPSQIHAGELRLTGRGGNTVVVQISVIGEAPYPSAGSDRNLKSNVDAVNPQDVLTRLAQIPVSTWNYTSDGPAVRHIGVMAQDFYAAFGLGETDTRIMQVDADGVAFAAIQGLYQMVQKKDAQIAALQKQNATLEARVTALEQRLDNQPRTSSFPLDALLPWLIAGGVGGILMLWRKNR